MINNVYLMNSIEPSGLTRYDPVWFMLSDETYASVVSTLAMMSI